MFRLLLQYIQNTQVFEGPEHRKYIALNADAFEKREYFEAGRLIALSIIHVGLGPHFFSELLFNGLTQEFDNLQPTIDDINDDNIRNEIVMAQNAPDLETIQNVLNNGTYFRLAGWEIINDFTRKDSIIKDVLKFYSLERYSKYFDQFTEGLKTFDVHKYMTKYPEYFIEIMCNTLKNLTFEDFEELFKIDYSILGSNKPQTESRIIAYWKDYILDCSVNVDNAVNNDDTEDMGDCTLEEILIFSTGSKSVPAMGFNSKIGINFLHNDCSRFPRGNTCGLELHLPTIHQNFENFKSDMNFGIKNGSVFALA